MSSFLKDKNGFSHDNFLLSVQMGKVEGAEFIWKFGYSNLNLLNQSNTIWDHNSGLYPYHIGYGIDAKQIDLVSSNPVDNGILVTIVGLDENGNKQSETIVIGGTSTRTYSRLFRMYNSNGILIQGETNAYVTGTTNILAHIDVPSQSTLMAIYTIPKGYSGFLTQGTVSVGSGKEGTVDYMIRRKDKVFNVVERLSIYQNQVEANRPYLPIQELSDIEVRYTPAQADTAVSSTFGILLLDTKTFNI